MGSVFLYAIVASQSLMQLNSLKYWDNIVRAFRREKNELWTDVSNRINSVSLRSIVTGYAALGHDISFIPVQEVAYCSKRRSITASSL